MDTHERTTLFVDPLSFCETSSAKKSSAAEVHGLTWHFIFQLRDRVAWHWYSKLGGRIPVEEFMSEGNQAITESLGAFAPQGTASFATYLYRHLSRRMWLVLRKEWCSSNETHYASRTRHAKLVKIVYKAPALVALPDEVSESDADDLPRLMPAALTTPGTQESYAYLRECIRFVARWPQGPAQTYMWASLGGHSCMAIARHSHRDESVVRRSLTLARKRLTAWSNGKNFGATAD